LICEYYRGRKEIRLHFTVLLFLCRMQLFYSRRIYFIFYFILLLSGATILFLYSREQIFFAINGTHNVFFDALFFYLTELGNTWTFIILIVISLFISRRMTLYLLATLILSSAVSQGLKHYIFSEHLRPLGYFQDNSVVHHLVASESVFYHSMPSGHSISVFALCTCVILLSGKRNMDLFFLFLATLTAYSRVYLGQHFFADIVAGSFIGVVSAILCYYPVMKMAVNERFNTPFFQIRPGK
jgi:membrane-associated phospholipid phosphatase